MKKQMIVGAVCIALLMPVVTACTNPAGETPKNGGGTDVPLTALAIPESLTLKPNQTFQLTVTKTPAGATDAITWTTSDETKVRVSSSGLVTAVANTTAAVTITAKSAKNADIADTCEVTVTEAGATLTEIRVIPATYSFQVGGTYTLTAEQLPLGAAEAITWSSSDSSKVSVNSSSGVITAVAPTTTAVTITATAGLISGSASVTVSEASAEPPELKLITNASTAPEGIDVTTTLPTPSQGKYVIESRYTTGNFANSGGFADTTFVYLDRLLTGDFKLRVRARMTDTTATSTSKGLYAGAFAPKNNSTTPVALSNAAGIFFRNSGGSGALPFAIRSIVSKPAEQVSAVSSGLNQAVGKKDEYIFEVIRKKDVDNAVKYFTTIYISKTGGQLATATVALNDRADDIGENDPVWAGVAFMSVKAEISQITLWSGDLEGDPLYYSGDSEGAPVPVSSIALTVQGATGQPVGTGTADSPATYTVRYSDVASSGIQLVPAITPAYAEEQGVSYFVLPDPAPTGGIQVGLTTGLVTATGPGTAIIKAISHDASEPEYYLTITLTGDYVPVGDFTITGGSDSIMVGQTKDFSTDIPAYVSSPTIVWTISSDANATFLDGTNEVSTVTGASATVKGLTAAASVTITATATTTDSGNDTTRVATKNIAVTAATNSIFTWQASTDDALETLASGATRTISGVPVTVISAAAIAKDSPRGWEMKNLRFVIGSSSTVATTSSDTTVAGTLDLSRRFKITVTYASIAGSTGVQLYINNNTSSQANSVLGGASRVLNSVSISDVPGEFSATVDPANFTAGATTLSTGFVSLRVDNSTIAIITGITIEYVTP